MRNRSIWFGVLLALAFCASSRADITYEGGDGRDRESAVVISGAPNTFAGVAAEGAWTARQHRGWRKTGQALINNKGRWYDVITYKTEKGPREVWFDITDFYGKNQLSH